MLLNLDDQQLRSSLAVWREALAVGRPALQGHGTTEQADSLARLDHMLAGCLAVLRSCTSADGDTETMRPLLEEVEALRTWIAEGRCALDLMKHSHGNID